MEFWGDGMANAAGELVEIDEANDGASPGQALLERMSISCLSETKR